MDVPTSEPLAIRAGDTVTWQRTLLDYSATDGWALKYRIVYPDSAAVTFNATGSGTVHTVTLPSATTAAWTAGVATLFGYVERTINQVVERASLGSLAIQVLPDLATASAYDGRSVIKQILDSLRVALNTFTASSNAAVQELTIGDRTIKYRTAPDLVKLIEYYEAEYRKELAATFALKPRVMYRG